MIEKIDIAKRTREYEDKMLADIEQKMDKRIPEAICAQQSVAFVIVEDYPPGVLRRMPELVHKYIAGGWKARHSGGSAHFEIDL